MKKIMMDEKKFYNTLMNIIITNIVFLGVVGLSVVDAGDVLGITVYATAIVEGMLLYYIGKRIEKRRKKQLMREYDEKGIEIEVD